VSILLADTVAVAKNVGGISDRYYEVALGAQTSNHQTLKSVLSKCGYHVFFGLLIGLHFLA